MMRRILAFCNKKKTKLKTMEKTRTRYSFLSEIHRDRTGDEMATKFN